MKKRRRKINSRNNEKKKHIKKSNMYNFPWHFVSEQGIPDVGLSAKVLRAMIKR